MKLIADSGSTKTKWHLFADSLIATTDCETSGINPFFQQSSEIVKTLQSEFTLTSENITSVCFYGAGAANELKKAELYNALYSFFGIDQIFIASDLLAAAHSLCGETEGIVAILGTGSNSCYYDGKSIVSNISPLGYVLGDEGSGAVLGKKLLADVLKNQLPQQLIKLFFETYQTSTAEVLENVYRKPYPNRYMASFTRFLFSHQNEPAVRKIIYEGFSDFFLRNIAQYNKAYQLPVNFTGGVAWHFRSILEEAAIANNFKLGVVTADPMKGLIDYHNPKK
jgi:N-acetylglucosamine kinase-like BadF-type ATPase